MMNWDRIEPNWRQLRRKVKERWSRLSDSQIDLIAGKRDRLIGKIQEVYGVTREEADRQIRSWESGLEEPPSRTGL